MRNFLFLFILSAILCSCPDTGESRYYDYTVENKSGKKITCIPYSDGNVLLDKKIILDNNQTLNKTYIDKPLYQGFSIADVIFNNSINNLSHIEIVFKKQKKIIYQQCTLNYNCNQNPKNIFSSENNNDLKEIYIVSLEDYQNATDCNGNCY